MASTLVVAGYAREIGRSSNISIPSPICQLIGFFYPRFLKIYGIGPNNDDYARSDISSLLAMSSRFKSYRYSEYSLLSAQCDHLHGIYWFHQDLFVMNTKHEIYLKHSKSKWQFDEDTMADSLAWICSPPHSQDADYITVISHGMTAGHLMMISNKGKFFAMGENDKGQLGVGNKINFGPIRQCENIQPLAVYNTYNLCIVSIACGLKHTLFLTSQGKVMSCGYNKHRQCGLSLNETSDAENRCQLVPKYVAKLGPQDSNAVIVQIRCGLRHNLCLSKQGRLYVFGSNATGQLGLGLKYHRVEHAWLHAYFESIVLTKIDCGKTHSLCLDAKGKVYLFGNNAHGQIGTDTYDDQFQCVREPICFQSVAGYEKHVFSDVGCGGDHSLLTRDVQNNDKEIIAFGYNNYGQVCRAKRDQCITTPYVISRSDMGCEPNERILRAVGGWESTLFVCE